MLSASAAPAGPPGRDRRRPPRLVSRPARGRAAFDEQQFYLDEFRGRTLLFALSLDELGAPAAAQPLGAVLRTLLANGTRVIVLLATEAAADAGALARDVRRRLAPRLFRGEAGRRVPAPGLRREAFLGLDAAAFDSEATATALLVDLWMRLRRAPVAVGVLPGASRPAATRFAQEVATRLRVHKLVLVEPEGGVVGADRKQIAFMDEPMLAALLEAGEAEWAGLGHRRHTFAAARAALLGGVAAVNVCTLAGLARELFSYTGSGTLFTREVYCTVQRLGIDDYAEVERLIGRGQREGVLKLRTEAEVAAMLVHGYGATIGAQHLAGICALLTEPYAAERAGELVGLYTITRFKGEGVGNRLLAYVLAEARARGLRYVFACTTEPNAVAFFERHGFRRVDPDAVPAAKWAGYEARRRRRLTVLRTDLAPEVP